MHLNTSAVLAVLFCFLSQNLAALLTPWEQIHQTLNTYALAIDSKTPSVFDQVFAVNAFANYTGPLSSLKGLHNISVALQASVANLFSQHQLGTTVIDIGNDIQTANSTTYFTASLFGTGEKYPADAHVFLFGQYRDTLVDTGHGWRIKTRYLTFMGPFVGNATILGG